jgi:hypothetical protein
MGLALAHGKVFAAWTDTRNGNQDVFFARYPIARPPPALNDRLEPINAAAMATNLPPKPALTLVRNAIGAFSLRASTHRVDSGEQAESPRKEKAMTDPERDHLLRRIHELEARLQRWRLTSLGLLVLLVLPILVCGLLGIIHLPNLERERAMLEAERDRAIMAERAAEAEAAARLVAEQRAQQDAQKRRVEQDREEPRTSARERKD